VKTIVNSREPQNPLRQETGEGSPKIMRMLQDLVLICLLAGACSQAQDTEAGKASAAPKLEFSNPRAVEDLYVAPMIVGRLDCCDDGSIYTVVLGISWVLAHFW
jgi:hypothetical protein